MAIDFPFPPLPDLLPFAGLLGAACFGLAVGPHIFRLLRQRAYDRAVAGERLRWVLRLDPRSAGDPAGAVACDRVRERQLQPAAAHPAGAPVNPTARR